MHHPGHVEWESVAAAVTHEAGTPLTVARGLLRSLLRQELDEEHAKLVDSALHQLGLVELQLVRLQRLDTEDWIAPDRAPVDLVALTHDLLTAFETTLLEHHPTRLQAPPELTVDADADQIRHLLFNLLSNAAKYSPTEQDIVVEIARTDGGVTLRVQDQGHGVAPPDAERIFEKYERATTEQTGAGLGLYLGRRIARAHGGDLRTLPAPQGGAIFELRLPDDT